MVNGINSQVSAVQLLNATNAFKAQAVKPNEKEVEQQTSDGVELNDNNNMLKDINLDEIKQFASMAGEKNLSEDDIKYGLTYGRSIMADWVV